MHTNYLDVDAVFPPREFRVGKNGVSQAFSGSVRARLSLCCLLSDLSLQVGDVLEFRDRRTMVCLLRINRLLDSSIFTQQVYWSGSVAKIYTSARAHCPHSLC